MQRILIIFIALSFTGCLGMPKSVTPVTGFELDRYLGKWYEIARLDHSFERGLNQVTAEYSLREDGGVKVINRGFSTKKNKWKEAEGKAYFVKEPNVGYLKVSFFGPFYGSYVIFDLDQEHYQYAFISGPDLSYLWLLSRTPSVEQEVLDIFISQASQLGFDTDKLIYVNQQQFRNGEVFAHKPNQAWDDVRQEWISIEEFWLSYAETKGGLTWGKRKDYPPYPQVKEHDTLIITLDSGPCLMEFFHSRWRRANDVRRWDPAFNQYGGCPYVFD